MTQMRRRRHSSVSEEDRCLPCGNWSAPRSLQKRLDAIAIKKELATSTLLQDVILAAVEIFEAEIAADEALLQAEQAK